MVGDWVIKELVIESDCEIYQQVVNGSVVALVVPVAQQTNWLVPVGAIFCGFRSYDPTELRLEMGRPETEGKQEIPRDDLVCVGREEGRGDVRVALHGRPRLPEAVAYVWCAVKALDPIRLVRSPCLFPLVEPLGREETAVLIEYFQELRLLSHGLRAGVDGAGGVLQVLRPRGEEAPFEQAEFSSNIVLDGEQIVPRRVGDG